MTFKDLSPEKDPKGGARTPPGGIRRSELQFEPPNVTYSQEPTDHVSKFTGIIISVLCTALIGMTVAWWTALQERGINRREMEEYVKAYSPYVMDKTGINEHQANQDQQLGRISGIQQDVLRRLDKIEAKQDGNKFEPP